MIIRFRCGHDEPIDPDKTINPACSQCGEKRIAFTIDAPAPRFVGHARGPLVNEKHLGATAVNLAKTPLVLKEPDDE